ncbi:MAG: radical SAM protein [candidate division FCPU426 bacterium]
MAMIKIMLIYPPGNLYQRGEDRCQANVGKSSATTVRACNDLGYASSRLVNAGYQVFLRDYQTERKVWHDLLTDFRAYRPDALFISTTNATVFQDLQLVAQLKAESSHLMVMLKGAIFFDPEDQFLSQLDLSSADYLIGGESDFIVDRLVNAHFRQQPPLASIAGILYRKKGKWHRTSFSSWETDLDSCPFPDRARMNNRLYTRPDTEEPLATITIARGCPASCIYCLTPLISGKRLRYRSPQNVLAELMECHQKYGLRNFFFKADTFTFDPAWVQELCGRISSSPLGGNIHWVANSRVKPLSLPVLQQMKAAGCWLVAFGFESGSQETLDKIKKSTTLEDNHRAARLSRQAGLQTFGFFMIGLPWENQGHLDATRTHLFQLAPDFIELHIAMPFYGTPLYQMVKTEGLLDLTALGKDYFSTPTRGTRFLSSQVLRDFRRDTLRSFYTRPGYVVRKMLSALGSPRTLINYIRYGLLTSSIFR